MDIERAMRLLSERLLEDVPSLAQRIFDHQIVDPSSRRALVDVFSVEIRKRNITASLESIFTGLASGRSTPDEPPAVSVEFARVAARSGIALQDLVRAYRVGQSLTWDLVLEQAETLLDDPAERLAALRLASHFLFDWNDQVTLQLSAAYQREHERMYRDRERRKRELIRDVLEGLPVDTGALGYDLGGPHVGVVGSGADPEDELRSLATALGASLLTIGGASDSVVGWLGGPALEAADFPEARRPSPRTGLRLALGRRCDGVDGFRLTHRQATSAWRVAQATGAAVTRYQDVTLETLVSDDAQHVREFVENELGPLLSDDDRDEVLRETLRTYFRTGQNAASAAPMLGVHERTVAYRIRTIEARLGCSIRDRREELAVALRLLALVDRGAGPPAVSPNA